jgi:molybdate transport system substrate-binding protein
LRTDSTPLPSAEWLESHHPSNRLPDAQHVAAGRVITVFSVAAVEAVLIPACSLFEQDGLWQLDVRFNTTPELKAKLSKGRRADVWIAPPSLLEQAGHIGAVGDWQHFAQVGVGVAVADGQVLPDVSTVSAWVQALHNASGIFYTHASSGQYVHDLLSSMGLMPQIAHKIRRFHVGEDMLSALAQTTESKGAMAMGAISEIRMFANRGLRFAGPLPEPIGHRTVYAMATDPLSPRLSIANRWVNALKQASHAADGVSTGIEPMD